MYRSDFSMACLFAAALFTLPGCGGAYSTAVGLPPDVPSWTPKLPEATISEPLMADPETRASVEELLEETRKVITSARFRASLAAYGEPDSLLMSPTGDYEDGKTVVASYLGLLEQRRPVPVKILGGYDSDVAVARTVTCDGGTRAVIQIGPALLKRWKRGTSLSKSCAINTLAHELTHTVMDFGKSEAWQPYNDHGDAWSWLLGGQRLVPYTVGSIAQCTYLEQSGDRSSSFNQCVWDRGTRAFDASGCDDEADRSEPKAPKNAAAATTDPCKE